MVGVHTPTYVLEHFYQGKLRPGGVPAGDFRVTAWSPGLTYGEAETLYRKAWIGSYNKVGSIERVRNAYAVIRPDADCFAISLIRASQLLDRGHFYPEYHTVICSPAEWAAISGDVLALPRLLEATSEMRDFESPEPALRPVEWSIPPRSVAAGLDAIGRIVNRPAHMFTLVSAVLADAPVAVENIPDDVDRLNLVAGLLALLPSMLRARLTFATEVFDSRACSAALKLMYADRYAMVAATDLVVNWSKPEKSPTGLLHPYALYLRAFWDKGVAALYDAVQTADRAAAIGEGEGVSGFALGALAFSLIAENIKRSEDWLLPAAVWAPEQFLDILANAHAAAHWPEAIRDAVAYIKDPAAVRSDSVSLVRASNSIAYYNARLMLALSEAAVAYGRLELLDQAALGWLRGIAQKNQAFRPRVSAIIDRIRPSGWVTHLKYNDQWSLLDLRVVLAEDGSASDVRSVAQLSRSMHQQWRGLANWRNDFWGFWRDRVAVYTDEHAASLMRALSEAGLPSYEVFDAYVGLLAKLDWQAPTLLAALCRMYAQQPLPAESNHRLLILVPGLLQHPENPGSDQLVIKALKRLFDKPQDRDLSVQELNSALSTLARSLQDTPLREGLYDGIMRVVQTMDPKTLDAFYRIVPRDGSMRRERAAIHDLLVKTGRIRRYPWDLLRRGARRRGT